jgi:SAM-dependent methyltransferase
MHMPIEDLFSLNKLREVYWVNRFLGQTQGETLLDVGCGTGLWTRFFGRRCRIALGVDIQISRLSQSSKRFERRMPLLAAEAERLPFGDKTVDKVISICALEHFRSGAEAIAEMNRVLKDRGILVMTVDSLTNPAVPKVYREFHRKKYFVNDYYNLPKIQAQLDVGGFELLEHRYIMNSTLAMRFQIFFHGNTRQRAILIPFMLPISILADHLSSNSESGMILVAKARKQRDLGRRTQASIGCSS